MSNPDWQMPDGYLKAIPQALGEIAFRRYEEGEQKDEFVYPVRARQRALESLAELAKQVAENDSGGPLPDAHLHLHLGDLSDAELEKRLMDLSPDERQKLRDAMKIRKRMIEGPIDGSDGTGSRTADR